MCTLFQVKFARPETEKAKAQRLSSFKYLEKKKAEEPWTNVQFFNPQVQNNYSTFTSSNRWLESAVEYDRFDMLMWLCLGKRGLMKF